MPLVAGLVRAIPVAVGQWLTDGVGGREERGAGEGEEARTEEDEGRWVLPWRGERETVTSCGPVRVREWRRVGLAEGAAGGDGLLRRMLAARRHGTWRGSAAGLERLRRQAMARGHREDGSGRWAVRELAEVRRPVGARGRTLEARVRWEGRGPDGEPWADTWVRVVRQCLSDDLRAQARGMERERLGKRGREGERAEERGRRRSARLNPGVVRDEEAATSAAR